MTDGKTLARLLLRDWQQLLSQSGPNAEVTYRLHKMRAGLEPLLDRPFFKTVKGQELLQVCLAKTAAVQAADRVASPEVYRLLTELETVYEELLRRTYEFRVKAG